MQLLQFNFYFIDLRVRSSRKFWKKKHVRPQLLFFLIIQLLWITLKRIHDTIIDFSHGNPRKRDKSIACKNNWNDQMQIKLANVQKYLVTNMHQIFYSSILCLICSLIRHCYTSYFIIALNIFKLYLTVILNFFGQKLPIGDFMSGQICNFDQILMYFGRPFCILKLNVANWQLKVAKLGTFRQFQFWLNKTKKLIWKYLIHCS